jgi:hypothetical protein
MEWVSSLGPWAWIIAGVILAILEVIAPGFFLLWFGLAAVITGAVLFVLPMSWPWAVLLFGLLAVMTSALGLRLMRKGTADSDKPFLNQRGMALVGRVFTLTEPIVNGNGRLQVDDSPWRIAGPDMVAGAKVRIVGVDGTTLKVEAANL